MLHRNLDSTFYLQLGPCTCASAVDTRATRDNLGSCPKVWFSDPCSKWDSERSIASIFRAGHRVLVTSAVAAVSGSCSLLCLFLGPDSTYTDAALLTASFSQKDFLIIISFLGSFCYILTMLLYDENAPGSGTHCPAGFIASLASLLIGWPTSERSS
ncbi:hypothetical protein IW261DRAFT_332391 [Armillaria novae-zelandiae]|uniref:Uncharacterized protein n=1 Tax=Armillaria novae-zelandiae TaxID=153914 RepID=A0AA39P3D5_9AGAR|nr:hypothetical protein IW261DRAFT_332391 [Armillaria novae-zelandiae]